MKIAILSCFYPYRGGISQFNACLYGELSKNHIVKAFNFKRQYPEFLFPGKTQFVTDDDEAVPVESVSLLDTANPFTYHRTYREIRDWNPDVLIVRYWMSYFAPSLGYITRKMKKHCKVISILDNVIPHEPHFFDTPLTRYFLKGSTGSITLCEAVSEDLLKISPESRYTVIQHPLYSHFGAKTDRAEAEKKLGLAPGKKNLLFFGQTGLGKTHLSLAIVAEVSAKGFGVVYGSAQNLFSAAEKEHFSYSGETSVQDSLLGCDLLVIDDLGTEFYSSFAASLFYNIVNTRLLSCKPTVINTNLSLDELEKKYTPRICSRFMGGYDSKKFIGSDIRQIKALER